MKPGNIYILKLVSGEEIIGELFNHFDRHYEIKAAAVIVMQQTQQGVGIALMPFMPYSEGNITLNRDTIVAEATPSQNMINEYNRIFGSGIQVASASALSKLQVVS
jgi:hypothetical protein